MNNNTEEDEGIATSLGRDWVVSLENRLSNTNFRDRSREPTIYRVPDILKSVDPQAYAPFLVSLGPYHRDKPHLQAMNQLKWKCLKHVLEQNPRMVLKNYVDLIKMSSNSFVEMMLLDGCFLMLTIIGRNYGMESTWWTGNVVVRDIFMLENQLPFFLLETLYESAFPLGAPFRNLAFEFIRMSTSSNMELPSDNETFHHVIHLCLSCIDPKTNRGNGRDANPEENLVVPGLPWIPSATVCNEAGIHFERKQKAKSFLDITFHNGKLEIPQLYIGDYTNMLLRNLIAYEQCSKDSKLHVTSYTLLMVKFLINTAADVELLRQHEIIIGDLGDSHEIATLFNKFGTNVCYNPDDFYLMDVLTAMRKHHDTRYNKWRARLNRDYFSNPWAIISLIGALVLFVLTVIQSTFTILRYFRPPK